MSFKIGDCVVHKSDKKPRNMVVAAIVKKNTPPTNRFEEMENVGAVLDGSYYCTWISGTKKGEGFFLEAELEMQ